MTRNVDLSWTRVRIWAKYVANPNHRLHTRETNARIMKWSMRMMSQISTCKHCHITVSLLIYISLHSKCFGFAAAIDTHIARCPRSFDEWSTSSMMVAHAIRRRLPCVVRNKLLLAHAARFPKLRSLFDQMPRSSGPPPRRQTHVSY